MFPNHPASLLLKHSIPSYEVLVKHARQALVADREAAVQVAEMDSLNAASCAGYMILALDGLILHQRDLPHNAANT